MLKKNKLFSLLLTYFFAFTLSASDQCNISNPDFTKSATEYHDVFQDLSRQVQYAKKAALKDSISELGLDPKIVDSLPPFTIRVLSSQIKLDPKEVMQAATAYGYKPTRPLPALEIDELARRNLELKDETPFGSPTFEKEVSGVKIAIDYQDYSMGRFPSHSSIDIDGFPQKTKFSRLPSDQMISQALDSYKRMNPDGVPLSQGHDPMFYRIVSRLELEELLSNGNTRANGSITDWTKDFATPLELQWIENKKLRGNGVRALINIAKMSPDELLKVQTEFKATFGRDLPKYFQTHESIKNSFVEHLLNGLDSNLDPKSRTQKDRLPDSTNRLMSRFTVNGQLDAKALGRYLEDNILSLPPGSKRNDAILDLFGYDYAARLHADYVPGFDEFSPFKGTSIGMPISDFLNKDTYLIAIRDVHGRARKNLGNPGEREWFFKDGLALDEVAGIWKQTDLSGVKNGDIMKSAPETIRDPNWSHHVKQKVAEELAGDPGQINR